MKLARKIGVALAVIITVVLGLFADFSVAREISLFEQDTRRDHILMGRTLASALESVWPQAGEAGAQRLLDRAQAGEHRVRLRWFWLDSSEAARVSPAAREALARGKESFEALDGARAFVTYIPLRPEGARLGTIELSEPRADEQRYLRATIHRFVIVTATMAAACVAMTLALGIWFIGRPMRQLVAAAHRVGAGDFSGRLVLRQNDEISELAQAMNVMCERLAAAMSRVAVETAHRIATLEQLRHADRLTTVGKLASGVAHELGTPLNVVHGRAELIVEDSDMSPEVVRSARIIMDQAERMTGIIRQLLDFGRRREPKKELLELPRIAARTIALLTPMAEKMRIAVDLVANPGQDLRAHVDGALIEQVLMNLIVNGLQSMTKGGVLTVTLGAERARPPADHGGPEADFLGLAVADQGSGIPPDAMERIFEPFFTTKDVGEGTGLGLSVSYGIIHDHGGWISVESEVGKGSTLIIHLPRATGGAEKAS